MLIYFEIRISWVFLWNPTLNRLLGCFEPNVFIWCMWSFCRLRSRSQTIRLGHPSVNPELCFCPSDLETQKLQYSRKCRKIARLIHDMNWRIKPFVLGRMQRSREIANTLEVRIEAYTSNAVIMFRLNSWILQECATLFVSLGWRFFWISKGNIYAAPNVTHRCICRFELPRRWDMKIEFGKTNCSRFELVDQRSMWNSRSFESLASLVSLEKFVLSDGRAVLGKIIPMATRRKLDWDFPLPNFRRSLITENVHQLARARRYPRRLSLCWYFPLSSHC